MAEWTSNGKNWPIIIQDSCMSFADILTNM